MPDGSYVVMKLELGSLQSVRDFVANLKAFKSNVPLLRPPNHMTMTNTIKVFHQQLPDGTQPLENLDATLGSL